MPIASKVRQKNLISKNGIFLTFSNAQFMFLHEKYALDIEESRKQQTYKILKRDYVLFILKGFFGIG